MNKIEIELPSEIKRLEIAVKNLVTSRLIGNYKSVFRGRGLEFETYREYTPEDDARLIDWKASNRVNKLLVKEFSEERNLDVVFLVDTSNKMLFGSTEKLKSQYVTELVSTLAYAILKANDNISLIAFNSKNKTVVPSGNGTMHFYKVAKVLLDKATFAGSFDIEEAIKFSLYNAKKGSLLILVSDFINPGKDWQHILKVASSKFEVIALMVKDPRDRELPANYKIVIESPESGKKLMIDSSKIKDQYSHEVLEEERYLREEFGKSNIDFALITTDKSFMLPLIQLFKRREKKWR